MTVITGVVGGIVIGLILGAFMVGKSSVIESDWRTAKVDWVRFIQLYKYKAKLEKINKVGENNEKNRSNNDRSSEA